MTRTWTTTARLTALTLTITLLATVNAADDAKAPPARQEAAKAMAEFAAPGPEHAKLNVLAGRWNYTCKVWMDPAAPPVEMTGAIERKWILGGRFLEERVAGTGFDGKPGFEAFGLIGYDKIQNKYTMTWACTMGTNTGASLGERDSDGTFTFHATCYCPVEGGQVPMIDTLRIVNDDKVVRESYRVDGQKKTKVMEIVAVRKDAGRAAGE